MAPRSSATFAKRQKERARQEKQEIKLQRRLQRKLEKLESPQLSESGEFASNSDVSSQSEPLSNTTTAAAGTAQTEKDLQ